MHDLIEFFCDLDELGAWLLSKTVLAAWYWLFPKTTAESGKEQQTHSLTTQLR
jgi:hypothetical protein